jgi:general secretion pathway protein D
MNRLLLAVLLAALSGCASNPSGTPDSTTPEKTPQSAGTKAGKPQDAPRGGDTDERMRLYPGTGILVREPTTPANYTQGGGNITLNFEGADLREVIRTVMGDILKENYIIDPRVGGTITLRTARPIPKAAALHTLEEVLRMNGTVIVREADGVFRIVPFALAGKGNVTPQIGAPGKPLPNGYSIQLVPLKFIGVADMSRILEPLAGEPSTVRADPLRNMLILAGTQLQIQHMLETIDMFDVDWISGMSVGLFTLKNIDAKTVMAELEKLLGDKNLGPLAGALRVIPIERLNALLVVTPQPRYLEEARKWVERIDRSGTGSGGQRLYVYPMQNGKAEQLATLLNDVFSRQKTAGKSTPAAQIAPGLKASEVKSTDNAAAKPAAAAPAAAAISVNIGESGVSVPQDVRVIADKDNNALLILASPADYENIEAALKKLDVAPRQVLIEATIAEITLKDELKYGLEWYFTNGAREQGKLDVGAAGIAQLVPGFSYSWVSAAGDIGAVLNALARDTKLKIISSPHITVADNQTAKIQVGDKVPTISQTQTVEGTSNGIINSVQYVETGVLLNVKPHINAGGLVNLEIQQEVSNAIPTETSGIDSPTIQKRAAQSVVTVQSGQTLVLAGLINETKSRSSEGLPLLSSIPIIGGLFGVEGHIDNRTELIVLITPRVLKNTLDASAITDEYRKRLTGLEDLMKSTGLQRPAPGLKLDETLPDPAK